MSNFFHKNRLWADLEQRYLIIENKKWLLQSEIIRGYDFHNIFTNQLLVIFFIVDWIYKTTLKKWSKGIGRSDQVLKTITYIVTCYFGCMHFGTTMFIYSFVNRTDKGLMMVFAIKQQQNSWRLYWFKHFDHPKNCLWLIYQLSKTLFYVAC